MRESLEAATAVALRRMGFLLSDRMESLARTSHSNVVESSYYLEESIIDFINSQLEIVEIEVKHRYLLVIHQIRLRNGLHQTTH